MLAGCGTSAGPTTPATPVANSPTAAAAAKALPSDDEILKQIDEALEFTYEHRRLSVNEQAAWQIIHGALPFKREFLVSDGTKDVSAVNYVLAGGKMPGWNLRRGDLLDEATKRYGIIALVEEDKKGQGHCDQWLGYLSDCQLPLDEPIIVEGEKQTIQDWIDQIKLDVVENPTDEYSWTLMCLTAYYPTDYAWKAKDGSDWNIEKLVEIELGHDLNESACGGTHRMCGLTMAFNRHVAAGKPIDRSWAKLAERIEECQKKAREYQNDDGSLSSNYFARPGKAADLAADGRLRGARDGVPDHLDGQGRAAARVGQAGRPRCLQDFPQDEGGRCRMRRPVPRRPRPGPLPRKDLRPANLRQRRRRRRHRCEAVMEAANRVQLGVARDRRLDHLHAQRHTKTDVGVAVLRIADIARG